MMSKRSQTVLALALATGPLLIANTAQAATSTCGTPAKDAVHKTVHHDAEDVVVGEQKVVDAPARPAVPATFTKESYEVRPAVEAVPEVTSTQAQWTRSNTVGPDGSGWALTGQTKSHEAVTTVQSEWAKVTQSTQYQWVLKVITQAASTTVVHHDAVYRTDTIPATYKDVIDVAAHTVHHDAVYDESLFAYVNKQGTIRYEPAAWNVEDEHDNGWTLVSPAEHKLVAPAYDEEVAATYKTVIDVPEHTVDVLVTPAWDETIDVEEISHYDEQWTGSATEAPGAGWERGPEAPHVTTETDTVYTEGDEAAPVGYELVNQRTSIVSPAYTDYEWARTVVVTPGQAAIPAVMGERDVLLTPAIPASAEVAHMEDLVLTIPAVDETVLVSSAVPAGPACAAPAAATTSKAPSAVPATLAFTGSETGLYLAGGLALIFAGSGLIFAGRRRQDAQD